MIGTLAKGIGYTVLGIFGLVFFAILALMTGIHRLPWYGVAFAVLFWAALVFRIRNRGTDPTEPDPTGARFSDFRGGY